MSKFPYTVKRSKRLLANINLRVKEGQVIISAPFWVSTRVIERFVDSKTNWISQALSKQALRLKKNFDTGEKHLLYGQELTLVVDKSKSPCRTEIRHDGQSIFLKINHGFQAEAYQKEVERAFLAFYLQELTFYITERVNFYTNIIKQNYTKIEIKKVSSIWGSCSPQNVLSFNRKLVQAPKEIIDYVIIHEVCHLKERNHSSRFWALVSSFDKEYKQHRRWLHYNQMTLDL